MKNNITGKKFLLAALSACFLMPQAGFAASLKPLNVISKDVFTVGDVFDGVDGAKAEKILGPAPQPGKDMTLNSSTLTQVSRALNLGWRPSSTADKVVLRRAATLMGTEEIRSMVSDRLRQEGLTGKFDLSFNGAEPKIILPESMEAKAEIVSFRFDPQKDWIEANIAAPSAENPVTQVSVSGKIQRFVKVPVLKETLKNGDVIGKNDIMMIEIPTQSLQPEFILDGKDMMGMTPRRLSEAGKPLKDADLQRPQVVSRGDSITIIYESGPIMLTTKGKAMQGGAKGDLVQVMNVSSNRSLDATISGDRQVTIIE